ncbi:hypothetical protein BIT28_24545 [Photobacterium proteolyticum]|uniref:Phenol degradation protein meta n=1 Tax=Photobacterium proteolyticum TaxID=1903952 RepID=A0A1Q9GCR6_9GAMM|nr:transporter [Photobacterium proteolyticum]OLQ72195.1 hypothetical protein BIT28_24545 [Photobacterium proteolyticum]
MRHIITFLFIVNFLSQSTIAAEGGYSNYIPGSYGDFGMALAPTETWTLRNDTYYYDASTSKTVQGGNLATDLDLQFLMNFTTLLYKPEFKIFGAQYTTGIFVPFVNLDTEASLEVKEWNQVLNSKDSASGLGDVSLIPFALFWNKGNFHSSFAHYIIIPSGDYDVNNSINSGLNYWSFDTNFAITYLNPETGHDFSFNLGHIYNTENEDTNYQTGQEIHLDLALNQFFSDSFAVGIHGFYLKQVTGDSGSGALLGDFKAEAVGVGPALLWNTKISNQYVSFIAKWLHEVNAENRLRGEHLFLSFSVNW